MLRFGSPRRPPFKLVALVVLSGCGQQHPPIIIDGETEAAFEVTLSEAAKQLSDADRKRFDEAVLQVRAKKFAEAGDIPNYQRLVRATLDGHTAKDIVAAMSGS